MKVIILSIGQQPTDRLWPHTQTHSCILLKCLVWRIKVITFAFLTLDSDILLSLTVTKRDLLVKCLHYWYCHLKGMNAKSKRLSDICACFTALCILREDFLLTKSILQACLITQHFFSHAVTVMIHTLSAADIIITTQVLLFNHLWRVSYFSSSSNGNISTTPCLQHLPPIINRYIMGRIFGFNTEVFLLNTTNDILYLSI